MNANDFQPVATVYFFKEPNERNIDIVDFRIKKVLPLQHAKVDDPAFSPKNKTALSMMSYELKSRVHNGLYATDVQTQTIVTQNKADPRLVILISYNTNSEAEKTACENFVYEFTRGN